MLLLVGVSVAQNHWQVTLDRQGKIPEINAVSERNSNHMKVM